MNTIRCYDTEVLNSSGLPGALWVLYSFSLDALSGFMSCACVRVPSVYFLIVSYVLYVVLRLTV